MAAICCMRDISLSSANGIDEDTSKLAALLRLGLVIRDTQRGGTVYKCTFTGADFVAWLVVNKHCATNDEAEAVGDNLISLRVLHHVTSNAHMKDSSRMLYRFYADEEEDISRENIQQPLLWR